MAKLPSFKEREGTSMSSAMMEPQIRPNVREHKAAVQTYIPVNDPNDHIRLAAAEAEQWKSISKFGNDVWKMGMAVYEANDDAKRMAANEYVKNRMAEFTNNAMENTPVSMTDPNTGQVIRPWDAMGKTYEDRFNEVVDEAREKYNFTSRTNQTKFDAYASGVESYYGRQLSNKQRDIYAGEAFTAGMEAIDGASDIDSVKGYTAELVRNRIITPQKEVDIIRQKGNEFASRDLQRDFMNVPLEDLEAVTVNALSSDYYRRYLPDDKLEETVVKFHDTRLEEGLTGMVSNHLVENPSDFDGALEMVDQLEERDLFMNKSTGQASLSGLREQIIKAESAYQKQLLKDQEKMDSYNNIIAMKNGSSSAVVNEDTISDMLDADTQLILDEEQRLRPGSGLNEQQAREQAILMNAPVFQRYGVFPAEVKAVFDNATKNGDGAMVFNAMQVRQQWRAFAPNAVNVYDRENEMNILKRIELRTQGQPIKSAEGMTELLNQELNIRDVDPDRSKKMFDMQVSTDEQKESYIGTIFTLGNYNYEELSEQSEATSIGLSMNEYRSDAMYLTDKWKKVYSDPRVVQSMVNAELQGMYFPVYENGILVPVKNAPELSYMDHAEDGIDRDRIALDLQWQREALAEGLGLNVNDWGYRALPQTNEAGQRVYFLENKTTRAPYYYQDGEKVGQLAVFTFDNPININRPEGSLETAKAKSYENVKSDMTQILIDRPDKSFNVMGGLVTRDWDKFYPEPDDVEGQLMLRDELMKGLAERAQRENWSDARMNIERGRALDFLMRDRNLTRKGIAEATQPRNGRADPLMGLVPESATRKRPARSRENLW